MTPAVSQSRQCGIIILAFTLLLLVLAAAVMVTRANRLPSSVAIDTTSRAQLVSLLNILKQQLIVQALGEDNTPGTLPCPNSPSCSANAAGLAGQPSASPASGFILRTAALHQPLAESNTTRPVRAIHHRPISAQQPEHERARNGSRAKGNKSSLRPRPALHR